MGFGLRKITEKILYTPFKIEIALMHFLKKRYSTRGFFPDSPYFLSQEDRNAPIGVLNRSGMLAMAYRFMQGNYITGDYLEFGCFSARTFRMAYEHSLYNFKDKVHFYAFDSFQGFPDSKHIADVHVKFPVGKAAISKSVFANIIGSYGVPPERTTIVEGWYDKTLNADLQSKMRGVKAGIIYIDCDLYTATINVLDFIIPFLQRGTVLCFDDYYCYEGDPAKGEQLAISEWIKKNPSIHLVDFYQYGWHGKSFLVTFRDSN